MRGTQRWVLDMTACVQFDAVAWWWTRCEIGRSLRKCYEVPKELPPELLALVRKLDAGEDNLRADSDE